VDIQPVPEARMKTFTFYEDREIIVLEYSPYSLLPDLL
jgi:hypothetical protein